MPATNKPAARFMTIEQVAEALSVGIPQVRSLLKSGELRGLQIGARGLWRIGVQDFEDYIAEAYRQTADSIASGASELSVADAAAAGR
ncbi:helix-turn-helix domain-containing protein [Arthrobacter sp. ISL-48]|uniref:helix-turn-helix domain-containing protein n=1 Tax=Arthrobacter sp. ISL-48 TaxID=2819110 RepID=UPI001BED0603|nr:helix-turn-helix domain-containing protein [Arthrobacter sp. ISL-48]MBT2532804.1 helix-turn-helix domain-containing protein [Arthrobacter sp. ISL-48]